jgi:hypothetical protein
MKIDVIMSIGHVKGDIPKCCGETMSYHITSVPMVLWTDPIIEPFKPIATKDAPVITTTKQNREYMARNHLVDANDLFEPPTREEELETNRKAQESISSITPTAEQNQQLKEIGLDSIID